MKRLKYPPKRFLLYPILLLGVLAILAFIVTLTPPVAATLDNSLQVTPIVPPAPEIGIGVDPLSPTEQETARQLALDDPQVSQYLDSDPTFLRVERHQEAKSVVQGDTWERRADVFIYNYSADRLVYAIVNLDTTVVDAVEVAQYVQLPITSEEAQAAFAIALANPAAQALIEEAYTEVTGEPLVDPMAQLAPFTLAYNVADYLEPFPGTDLCGLHRCAFIRTFSIISSGDLLDVFLVIDLSTSQVVFMPTS